MDDSLLKLIIFYIYSYFLNFFVVFTKFFYCLIKNKILNNILFIMNFHGKKKIVILYNDNM